MRFYTVHPACDPVPWITRAVIVFLQLYYLVMLTAFAVAAFVVTIIGALVIVFANTPLWALGGSTTATAGMLILWTLLRVLRRGPLDLRIVMGSADQEWLQIVEKEAV